MRPAAAETRLARTVVWLPEGDWFDFWSGERYQGGTWHARYGGLDDIPVYARAGAIVPLAPRVAHGGVDNPAELELHIFPGASNRFELYEDDGCSQGYTQGHSALTPLTLEWKGDELEFAVGPVQGDRGLVPARRRYTLVFKGMADPDAVALAVNGQPHACAPVYDAEGEALRLAGVELAPGDALAVTLRASGSLIGGRNRTCEALRRMLRAFRLESFTKHAIDGRLEELIAHPERLAEYDLTLAGAHTRALVEVALSAGVELVDCTGAPPWLILWNSRDDPRLRYRHSTWNRSRHFALEQGAVPRFQAIEFDGALRHTVAVDYVGLVTIAHEG